MRSLEGLLAITFLLLLSAQVTCIQGENENVAVITGVVLNEENKPLQKAFIAVFGPGGFRDNTMTDSSGRFDILVNREGLYGVYVGYDDPETPGIDYVPSVWWTHLELGSAASYWFTLEKGASLYIDGEIWFVERSQPADFFTFTVVRPDGSPLGGRSIRTYGSDGELSRLGMDPRIVIIPADTEVAINVYARVDFHISHQFLMRGKQGYFKLSQGEALHVDVRGDNLNFNIESMKSMLDTAFHLLKDAEDTGFLVTVERYDLLKSYNLVDAALLSFKRESYDESFANLRNAYVLTTDSMGKLQGLLQIGSQSALMLLFFFVFIASASAYLITDRDSGLEIILRGESKFFLSLNLIIAVLLYAFLVGFFYILFPGCRLVPWETFIATGAFALIVGQIIVIAAPRAFSEKKSERRSIQFRSAVIVAFSMACRNLRRRRLRTTLSLVNMMVLVFGFIAFTSISPGYGLVTRRFRPVYPVDAILIRDRPTEPSYTLFIPLPGSFIEWLKGQPNITLTSPKAENTPRSSTSPLGYLRTKSGDILTVQGIMGIIPSVEASITCINETVVIGDYLEDDDLHGTLVSSTFHEKYGIEVGDKLYGFEREFIVRGFFDPEALESLKDLDAQYVVPYMIIPMMGPRPCYGDDVIIVTYGTALQMPDVSTSRVVIQLEDLEDYPTFAYMIAYSREYTVFIAHPDSLEMRYLGGYLEEKGAGLIPLLMILVISNIGATMMGSVKERRNEIAALSSIGLNPIHIASLFVAEATVLGFVGGGLGFLLGISGYRLASTAFLGALQVREKVSAEWGLIALLISGLTAILASLIPALQASTIVTPSLLRRWRLERRPKDAGQPWVLDLPVKLRTRELEPFEGFILMGLREPRSAHLMFVSDVSFEEEETVRGPVVRIRFKALLDEGRASSENEIVISREEGKEYFNMKMICNPSKNAEQIVVKTVTYVRKIMLEWEALTFEVATPFDPSLRQLYTLVNAYTPTSLYVITTEPDIWDKLGSLKRRLELEGLRPPRMVISRVDRLDVNGCMKLAEDVVSKVDVVCISGGPSAITTALAMNAMKQKKMICYIVDPKPVEERMKNPFEALKIVNL